MTPPAKTGPANRFDRPRARLGADVRSRRSDALVGFGNDTEFAKNVSAATLLFSINCPASLLITLRLRLPDWTGCAVRVPLSPVRGAARLGAAAAAR
jgi:hypothetical protein